MSVISDSPVFNLTEMELCAIFASGSGSVYKNDCSVLGSPIVWRLRFGVALLQEDHLTYCRALILCKRAGRRALPICVSWLIWFCSLLPGSLNGAIGALYIALDHWSQQLLLFGRSRASVWRIGIVVQRLTFWPSLKIDCSNL